MEEVSISLMENHVESANRANGEEGKVEEVQVVAPAMIIAGEVKEDMEVMEVKDFKVEVKDFRDKVDLVDKDFRVKVVLEVKVSSKEVKDSIKEVRDSIREVSNNKVVLVVLRKVGDLVKLYRSYSLNFLFE